MIDLATDEKALIEQFRQIKVWGHGRIEVQIRNGQSQIMELTSTKTFKI